MVGGWEHTVVMQGNCLATLGVFKYSVVYSSGCSLGWNFDLFLHANIKNLKWSNNVAPPFDCFTSIDIFTWKIEEFSFSVQQIPMTKWKQTLIFLQNNLYVNWRFIENLYITEAPRCFSFPNDTCITQVFGKHSGRLTGGILCFVQDRKKCRWGSDLKLSQSFFPP